MPATPPTPDDLTTIAQRLGRSAPGVTVLAVAARDAQGKPAVITNHPLRRQGKHLLPFPTLYWLIDPVWCKRVADLERDGAVGELERLIHADDALCDAMFDDHARYAATRWALLTPDQMKHAVDAGYAETLRDKGIGGVADFAHIKCLHLHMAHHLAERATGNEGTTVGQLIEARLVRARSVSE